MSYICEIKTEYGKCYFQVQYCWNKSVQLGLVLQRPCNWAGNKLTIGFPFIQILSSLAKYKNQKRSTVISLLSSRSISLKLAMFLNVVDAPSETSLIAQKHWILKFVKKYCSNESSDYSIYMGITYCFESSAFLVRPSLQKRIRLPMPVGFRPSSIF